MIQSMIPSSPSLSCYLEPLLPDSIRLLRLLPNEDGNAPIQCELFHCSLQDSGKRTHPYDALSYVWGDPGKPQPIFVREHNSTSEHNLLVTKSLHEALLRLRNCFTDRIMWIDAISINQKDDREKEQQIQFMATIYAQANRVVVWLGETADDSDQALQEIRKAGGKKLKQSFENDTIQQAVTALLQRPWFRRIWILQEVAAARYVLIMCGPIEIDGYAFCLGVDSFEGKARADLPSFVRSVTYLIRGAIFRPEFSLNRLGRSSLDICPLGELMDMYHTHKATARHDKVYALLGMSSDDLRKVNILPDYSVPWEELLERLARYLLSVEISVKTWGGDREVTVIRSKGCILGRVFLVERDTAQDAREGVNVILKNSKGSARWTLQASAKSIQDGDLVCLLQAASKPTIIRPSQDYFDIIMIAARPPERIPMGGGYMAWPKVLQSGTIHTRDILLLWDWETSNEDFQQRKEYEALMTTNNQELENMTEFDSHFEEATRVWNVSLILADSGDYQKAKETFQEAVEGYKKLFRIEHQCMLKTQYGLTPLSWAAGNGHEAVVRLLLAKDGIDIDLKDSQHNQTPLSFAAGGGHEAVVKLLLETGKVDVDVKDRTDWTPLLWAASGGNNAVVKLLLETGKVEVDAKDCHDRTPLLWAARGGHEAVVKLLLETGKVEADAKDCDDWTPLSWAARGGYEAVVKLLLETDKVNVDAIGRDDETPLSWAARGGHHAVVKLLLNIGKVKVDAKDCNDWTPLSWAARGGHEAVIKLLLETGKVNVDAIGRDDETPLSWAARGGHYSVVKLLLETGKVKVNAKDCNDRTPLWWATREGHKTVIKLLQSNTV